MSILSQKEAVYSAVVSVLADNGVVVAEGTDFSTIMTRELRSLVNQVLFQGFRSGNITLDREAVYGVQSSRTDTQAQALSLIHI